MIIGIPKIRENRAPRIREIGSLQIQTGFPTFSLKKTLVYIYFFVFSVCTFYAFRHISTPFVFSVLLFFLLYLIN